MSEEDTPIAIEILKEIPFFGEGDTIESRLRRVTLRGFPHIRIYKNAQIREVFLTPEQIKTQLHTPQPSVYQTHLNKVAILHSLFKREGIDLLKLERGYDFIATSESGKQTNWTLIPPTVERFTIPPTKENKLNYEAILAEELKQSLKQKRLWLHQPAIEAVHTSPTHSYNLINDGSHRIHYGFENQGVKVFIITSMTPGYPYYAIPQPYTSVVIHPSRDQSAIDTKIHVIQDPGHKELYRLFPSGGIMSGDVRPLKAKEN